MHFKKLAALLTAIACQLPPCEVLAQTPRAPDEYEVKAAFIYNFAIYTEWPVLPTEAFEFCVLGTGPFDTHLNKIGRKTVHGKPIHIRHLTATDDISGCHLLFVPAQEKDQYYRLAPLIKQQAVLTITDAPQQDEKWPMIMITLVPEKILPQVSDGKLYTFDINHATAKAAGLTLSSKLLRLARNVK